MYVCLSSNVFQITTAASFSRVFTKLHTRDLCGNTEKCGTDFLNFDFSAFGNFLNFKLVCGRAAAHLSRPGGLFCYK